jgi:hypothetical protein
LLGTPAGWAAQEPLLALAERLDKPVLVHPGPAGGSSGEVPGWWAPLVDYTRQLHAAWWAWHAYGGRTAFPHLRLCFVAAAGLAPAHHERLVARGGRLGTIDANLYVDTSATARRASTRWPGSSGSIRSCTAPTGRTPRPPSCGRGDAATAVIRYANPRRFLFGTRAARTTIEREVQ